MSAARLPAAVCLAAGLPAIAAVDLAALWDFSQPAASEQRLRAALAGAQGDDALILQTQIARSYGLRREFERARELLAAVEPQLASAGPEARVRHALEWGRSFASATHPPASQTDASRAQARAAFTRAAEIARAGRLDGLQVDALHMMVFVDTAPDDQRRWNEAALAVIETSSQPAAKAWEASIRNNLGVALREAGRPADALVQFERALALRERGTNERSTRVARWMVARTLRDLGRVDEALAIQLRLERESDAAGQPDPYVFEELEQLSRARGDDERARRYAALRRAPPR